METITIDYNGYLITTNKDALILSHIHKWLSEEAYWSKGIPYHTVANAVAHSHCVGVLHQGNQIAFARLVTDYATFGYLADVYVQKAHRGVGLSKKMMEVLLGQEWVKGLRRIMLSTISAHELYRQYDFKECRYPDRLMEILRSPDMYLNHTDQ